MNKNMIFTVFVGQSVIQGSMVRGARKVPSLGSSPGLYKNVNFFRRDNWSFAFKLLIIDFLEISVNLVPLNFAEANNKV